jgi:exodeoxyribonuclease VII large subunit
MPTCGHLVFQSHVSCVFHDGFTAKCPMSEAPLTVSELNQAVAGCLERSFPLVRVRGEIAQVSRPASGHLYFSLRDASASVRAVMFRGKVAVLGWQPREGDQVEVGAVVTLYEPRGDFQLRIERMQKAGQGALFEAFLALRQRLATEGLLAPERKRHLPDAIRTVGLVSSLGAAALRDVVVTLSRAAPRLRVRLYPSLVQGAEAPGMLCSSLALADADSQVDVILLVRGGGSLEDLQAFNHESVARAIAACHKTVVCGVGHETDVTIADLVADIRAATPTAAAQMVAAADQRRREQLAALAARMRQTLERRWRLAQQRLDMAGQRLRSPAARLREQGLLLGRMAERMRAALAARVSVAGGMLQARSAAMRALDPGAVLRRGYAIALDAHGRAVTDAATVASDDPLRLMLAKGLLDVRVESTHRGDEPG